MSNSYKMRKRETLKACDLIVGVPLTQKQSSLQGPHIV